MLRALRLGSVFGIPIYIHWSFLLLPLIALITSQGAINPVFLLLLIGAVFACVVLHELGHALMARYFGIGTRDITIYPIGGVARLERMGEKPWEEIWIAVAGPAVNVAILALLILGGLASLLLFWNGPIPLPEIINSPVGSFLAHLGAANLLLVLFNMIPAFPMDGGRVFRAVLSLGLGQLRATRIAAGVGMVISLLFMLGGLLSLIGLGGDEQGLGGNPLLLLVGMFVLFAGQMELRQVEWKHRIQEEEPLEVIPVRRPVYREADAYYADYPSAVPAPVPNFSLKPRISVYVWDNQAGGWVKEPGTS